MNRQAWRSPIGFVSQNERTDRGTVLLKIGFVSQARPAHRGRAGIWVRIAERLGPVACRASWTNWVRVAKPSGAIAAGRDLRSGSSRSPPGATGRAGILGSSRRPIGSIAGRYLLTWRRIDGRGRSRGAVWGMRKGSTSGDRFRGLGRRPFAWPSSRRSWL